MLRIGLTGGIGSGKSTVAAMFAHRAVPVIDADEISRELVTPGTSAYREIVASFGPDILTPDGTLDRARLRALIFDNDELRKRLETILHPRVRAEIARRVQDLQGPYCVIVVPLLIEAGQQELVDRLLVVDATEELQIERVRARSHLPEAQTRKIIDTQLPREARIGCADDVIVNDSDLQVLEGRVETLHQRYLALAAVRAGSS